MKTRQFAVNFIPGPDPRIAVEQQQIAASCHRGALIVAGTEAEIARISNDARTADLIELAERAVS